MVPSNCGGSDEGAGWDQRVARKNPSADAELLDLPSAG